MSSRSRRPRTSPSRGQSARHHPGPRPRTAERSSSPGSRIDAEASEVAAQLQSIRQLLRQSILEQARQYPVSLTAPQLLAMELLVDRERAGERAPSLRELSQHLGLAHSTVSGIIDRLEAARIVARREQSEDRRYRHVELTARARDWVAGELPRARDRPLTAALARATASERRSVLQGLRQLNELLARAAPAGRLLDGPAGQTPPRRRRA